MDQGAGLQDLTRKSYVYPPLQRLFKSSPHYSQVASCQGGAYGASPTSTAVPRVATSLPARDFLYRPIQPSDLVVLQQMHESLFPIKYEPDFYASVVNGKDILSWAAVDPSKSDDIIAFVTLKVTPASSCEASDLLGFELVSLDRTLVYILTLGVAPQYRNRGIASTLVCKVVDFAQESASCRAVYLHVITYNRAAIRFYQKHKFQCVRQLAGFYWIGAQQYDADLYALYVNGGRPPFTVIGLLWSIALFLQGIFYSAAARIFWRRSTRVGLEGEQEKGRGAAACFSLRRLASRCPGLCGARRSQNASYRDLGASQIGQQPYHSLHHADCFSCCTCV